jgi:hypothetical protein
MFLQLEGTDKTDSDPSTNTKQNGNSCQILESAFDLILTGMGITGMDFFPKLV